RPNTATLSPACRSSAAISLRAGRPSANENGRVVPAVLNSGAARLLPVDLLDLVGLGAAGGIHLDGLALLLVQKGARERRRDRNLAGLGVGLRLADDLPHALL